MIDIPIGKALVPVEADTKTYCKGCASENNTYCFVHCCAEKRADGKNVIFKLVDWPVKEREK